jgi:hypothetical protein
LEKHTASIFRPEGPEDGGSMFLPNVDIYLLVYIALLLRRPTSTLAELTQKCPKFVTRVAK